MARRMLSSSFYLLVCTACAFNGSPNKAERSVAPGVNDPGSHIAGPAGGVRRNLTG